MMTWQIYEHVLKYTMEMFKVNSTFQLTEHSLRTSVQRVYVSIYIQEDPGSSFCQRPAVRPFLFLRKITEYTST